MKAAARKAKPPRRPPPGHGRNGQNAYWGAKTERVSHHKLKPGDRCPACGKGKVYELRCNLCAKIFPARPPTGVGTDKYDVNVASMIGLLKYGGGFPWNRLEKLQSSVGIPLPSATQWDIVREAARKIEPVCEELQRQAAQGEVLHNDDTTM